MNKNEVGSLGKIIYSKIGDSKLDENATEIKQSFTGTVSFVTCKTPQYRSDSKTWFSPSAEKYENIIQVGEGTYGKVYKAKDKTKSQKFVALKCVLMDQDRELGFPVTALREIVLLKSLKHENIINLIEIVSTKATDKSKGNVYLVFEYMDYDLSGFLKTGVKLQLKTIKSIFYQALSGLNYLHKKGIIHRDIKSANMLLSKKGEVKVGDFGLARKINPNIPPEKNIFTNNVVTLWYRAPEILLGSINYTTISDVWSLGCMFLEILKGEVPFRGSNEKSQIQTIFEKCGTPVDAIEKSLPRTGESYGNSYWPESSKLPLFESMIPPRFIPSNFEKSFRECW